MFSAQGVEAQAQLYFYIKTCKISDLQTIQIFRIIWHQALVQNVKQYVLYDVNEEKAEIVKMMEEMEWVCEIGTGVPTPRNDEEKKPWNISHKILHHWHKILQKKIDRKLS